MQMTSPKVSIFMPVYNSAPYLAQTIESILLQTFGDFELLIADDGSTDDSREISRSYANSNPRIRCLELQHLGEVAARNAAVTASNPASDYLMNHDSDDISLPEKLHSLVDYLDSNPTIAVVGCFAEYFDDGGNNLGVPEIESNPDAIRDTFGQVNSMINSASLIRREVFQRIGPYREELRSVDDYDFFARALMAGFQLANIPRIMHRIRLHPKSVCATRSHTQRQLEREIQAAYLAYRAQQNYSRTLGT